MLHIIGYLIMTYNHIWIGLDLLGRVPLPALLVPLIFSWLIVNGYYWTKDFNKYMTRLLIIAVVSQPFYSYLFETEKLNIVFTYTILMLLLKLLELETVKKEIVIIISLYMAFIVNTELAEIMLPVGLIYYYIRPYVIEKVMFLHKIRINKNFIRIYYPAHLIILAGLKIYFNGGL